MQRVMHASASASVMHLFQWAVIRIFPLKRITQNAITLTLDVSDEREPKYNDCIQCKLSAFKFALCRIYIRENVITHSWRANRL